jgi:hypothetical protein
VAADNHRYVVLAEGVYAVPVANLRLGHLSDSGKFSLKKDGVSCIIFIFENQIMKGNADA